MPSKHSWGDDGSVVLYAPDVTTGVLAKLNTTSGALQVFLASQPAPSVATSGGLLNRKIIATADTNAALIKTGASQFYGVQVLNVAAYPIFLKLFNKATAPVAATDTPVMVIGVPAGQSVDVSRTLGVEFTLGLGMVAVKGSADLDVVALLAGDLVGTVHYK